VLKGWATLYPRFVLTPAVDGMQVLTLALLAVVPYTAATLVPSWRAAIADPAAAMRGQP
jgi:ABC-type lipoprotein release transport system permease subunit